MLFVYIGIPRERKTLGKPAPRRLVAVGATDDHKTFDGVGNTQHTVNLSDTRGFGMKIDQRVVTVGQPIHLKGELPLAPFLDVVDNAILRNERRVDSLEGGATVIFGQRGINKI
jgi:hypothetical protein